MESDISTVLKDCNCKSADECFLYFSLDPAVSETSTWLFLAPPKQATGMVKPNLKVNLVMKLLPKGNTSIKNMPVTV